jgi:DNA-binding response OmpR family regulator
VHLLLIRDHQRFDGILGRGPANGETAVGEPRDDREQPATAPRAAHGEGGTLRTHDLEIDTAARVVTRGGRRVRLTPREYALLEFLARHQGRVVSRAIIWTTLYDETDAGTSNVIDVYIRYLRRKIDRGFDPPLILTRRGVGYMLRADGA